MVLNMLLEFTFDMFSFDSYRNL